ncbi:MAG TPA: cupin domain-containing protein [Hyalangium sp.]|nr:cupin domain-containing protein [Hyalangium sp.]
MARIEEGYSLEHHVEGESRHLGAPLLRLDLAKEIEELRQTVSERAGGHHAKTLLKHPDLRVVLMALKKGATLGEHKTKGRISIHTLEGHVLLNLEGQVVDLPAGCLLGIGPSVPHDVEAVEQSVILLTIAWPTAAAS